MKTGTTQVHIWRSVVWASCSMGLLLLVLLAVCTPNILLHLAEVVFHRASAKFQHKQKQIKFYSALLIASLKNKNCECTIVGYAKLLF